MSLCYTIFMDKHFLQTQAWGDFQKSQNHEVFYEETEKYSFLAILDHTPLGNYLFVPYGPHAQTKKDLKTSILALKQLAARKNAIFIRIEPIIKLSNSDIKSLKLQKTKDIEPKHTQIINLDRPETEILAEIQKEKVRHWRNHKNKKMVVKTTQDPTKIDILYNFYAQTAKNNHFIPHDRKYLADQLAQKFATLYYIELDGEPIAASIIYDDKTTRYYAHAAADYEHRRFYGNAILVIQMIIDAKAAGKKSFDLWGVTPSKDPNDSWFGFTSFKKSFGGTEVEYAGTYDLPINPAKYAIYKILRQVNLKIRKIIKK